jgi:hypothetical protein
LTRNGAFNLDVIKARKAVVQTIARWAALTESRNLEEAMEMAATIPSLAEDLCLRPEFDHAARVYCNGVDALTAVKTSAWLLMCITELEMRDQQMAGNGHSSDSGAARSHSAPAIKRD